VKEGAAMKSKKVLKITKWRIYIKAAFVFSIFWLSAVGLMLSFTFSSLTDYTEMVANLPFSIPFSIIFAGFGIVVLFLSISRRYTFYEDKMIFHATLSSSDWLGSFALNKVERSYADVVVMERETSKNKNGEKVELLKVLLEGDNLTFTLKYDDPRVQKIYKCYKECRHEVDDDDPFAFLSNKNSNRF
jgi:hypothetical protein